jgi:nitrite reductase/ring-hydroxylating ferredoxin subunit/Fe-S cluster biogenesis protein NfuA
VTADKSLEELVGELERLDLVVRGWDAAPRATVTALRETLEAIQAGAFRRLLRAVKAEPGGLEALTKAVDDGWIAGVLGYHGLLRAPGATPPRARTIEEEVEAALESVRPTLIGHQGNVELVAVVSPQEVHIRLVGSCDGCTFSEATVRMGIETAIKERVPTLELLKVVDKRSARHDAATASGLVQLRSKVTGSPFERPWQDGGLFVELAEGGTRAVELPDTSVLVARARGELRAYPNACPHLGMPLDGGHVEGGVLHCPYHKFEFDLATGECLTAPDVALVPYPVRVRDGRLEIQVVT